MQDKEYIDQLQIEKEKAKIYYEKFFSVKSEQQKKLEEILSAKNLDPETVADIACGAGSLTYHIRKLYPKAAYKLVDLNHEAIALAQIHLSDCNCEFIVESIYDLSHIKDNSCDIVFCWQTLSWIENVDQAILELLRITRKGGLIFCSSLFNINHDVDISSRVLDHTKESAKLGLWSNYNVYSKLTIANLLENQADSFVIHEFTPNIDFKFDGKGMGTYTIKDENGKRIQFSAGLHMNWGILEIQK